MKTFLRSLLARPDAPSASSDVPEPVRLVPVPVPTTIVTDAMVDVAQAAIGTRNSGKARIGRERLRDAIGAVLKGIASGEL